MSDPTLRHVERLSADPKVLRYARRINKAFLDEKKTDIEHLDSEYEAVVMEHGRKLVAIVVFMRVDSYKPAHIYCWIPVVWVDPIYRGMKLYLTMIKWLKKHARSRGCLSLSTEVKAFNKRMIEIQDKTWTREYIRYTLKLRK